MKSVLALLHGLSTRRMLMALVLASVATLIVAPYFADHVPTGRLWLRLSIVALVMLLAFTIAGNVRVPGLSRIQAQFAALVVSAFFGTLISGLVAGRSLTQMFTVEPMFLGVIVFTAVAMAIGVVAATLFVYRERETRAWANLQASEAARLQLEKQVLEARVKVLQAQIEPHFLFNTLANVQHLVDADPPRAAATLESLIVYLRAALPTMREEGSTLGRELAMAQAYLEIQKLRMGGRLSFSMAIPRPLESLRFPPMMLLTLVENALKHGIDPLQQGGHIGVAARCERERLIVEVADTGQGLSHSADDGVGLSNIRERLATLFGKSARLVLEENTPRGVVARIILPVTADADSHV